MKPVQEVTMAIKKCSRCELNKPHSEFHTRKASKDGLTPICKPCAILKSQEWYAKNIDRKKAFDKEYNKTPARMARQLAYRETVRDREKARAKAWYEANRERARKASAERFLRERERHYQRSRQWKKNNRGSVNADTAARRAALKCATPRWSDRRAIRLKYLEAAKCGLHVDHIVPLQSKLVCGLHVPENLQLMSPQENFEKNNKHWPDMP